MNDWTPDTEHVRTQYTQDHVSDAYESAYEAEFDRWLQTIKAQAWQDGHDTALINGQTKNPYEQEPR